MTDSLEISVQDLKSALDDKKVVVLDVRTDAEYGFDHLPSVHIPLHDLPHRLDELEIEQPYAVICGSGVRSMQATVMMREVGFLQVHNVAGGVKAWQSKINPNFKLPN